jgi:hypothetical protein
MLDPPWAKDPKNLKPKISGLEQKLFDEKRPAMRG